MTTPNASDPNDNPVMRAFGAILRADDTEEQTRARTRGAWVAFYSDRSGVSIFAREIDALRHALPLAMRVEFIEWGGEIG